MADSFVDDQRDDHPLRQDLNIVFNDLFVKGLENVMSGFISSETGAWESGPAERSLGDPAIFAPAERAPPVFELVDQTRRGRRHDFDRVLIGQIIATFDGVKSMPFGVVVFPGRIIGQ